jgi:hypothetical protein
MLKLPYFTLIITFLFSLAVGIIHTPLTTLAAETLVFKSGLIQATIPVEDLENLVKYHRVSPKLAFYLEKTNSKPEDLSRILGQEIEVNTITLSKILNTPIGERLLDLLSSIIMTPSGRASRESLRGALVTSALEDNRINLLEILINYPTAQVHLDGDRLIKVYNRFSQILELVLELKP